MMHQDHYDQEDVDRMVTYGDLRAIVKETEDKYPSLRDAYDFSDVRLDGSDFIIRNTGITAGELRTYYGARFLLEK